MKKFGVIGCGAIGSEIARAIADGRVKGRVSALFDIEKATVEKLAEVIGDEVRVCQNLDEMICCCDYIIEAASQNAVRDFGLKICESGKDLMIMSVGAFSDEKLLETLKDACHRSGSNIHIPSGAVCGVDGILAARCADIDMITIETTKPPKGLEGVSYLEERGIDVNKISKPTIVFEGDSSLAAKAFPKNINVATILKLASDKAVTVRIIADPYTSKNTHKIMLAGSFGKITTICENIPAPNNPKTSYMAILSALAVLRKSSENPKIGN